LLSDDELLGRLRVLLAEDDPVPAEVVSAARDIHSWPRIDAELARLVEDSLLSATAVRGDAARLLTFQADAVSLEIEVTEAAGRLQILGQVLPPTAAQIRVEQPGDGVDVSVGQLGRFTAENLRPGPTRFICTLAEQAPVRTEWTLL
jgi:hypothetical protein